MVSPVAQPDPIERFLASLVRRKRLPGAAWRVDAAGRTASRGAVGFAALEPNRCALSANAPFDLSSLTKPLCTALLLVLLEREERIDLDQPVGEILDPFRRGSRGSATLRDLACHTAGLPAWRPLYLRESTLEGYLERIAAEPPALAPGRMLYSDLGYIALGAVLERVTGLTLDRLFAERIASPLGLGHTGFARDARFSAIAAATERGNAYEREMAGAEGRGHGWRTHVLRGEVHDGNAWGLGGVAGHAGLFGTADEVASIAAELLQQGKLGLDSEAAAKMLEPVPGSGGRTIGMLLARGSPAARGVLPDASPGHTGFAGTSLWLDPPRGGIYVLLTNRVHPRVSKRSFQPVRRAFHRLAAAITHARSPGR